MKNEDVEQMLNNLRMPEPEAGGMHPELKIPLLSYRRSSREGLWLLLLPFVVAVTAVLKLSLSSKPGYVKLVQGFFAAIDRNAVLTYLIPLIFIGFPLAALVLNLLAFCHFQRNHQTRELIITVKYRPLNIALFLGSLALLVFFLLPDKLSFH
ncbi:MAG: hypothetical protein EOO12_15660 [Chitinophagaceae bacterium]|nr:MAG: hypothetical protein EOO12_15660 [Chitinophagaceae bacterium]